MHVDVKKSLAKLKMEADQTTREVSMNQKLYAERDIIEQGEYYTRHVSAMTGEGLHYKSDIASELAHRDIEIATLRQQLAKSEARVAELEDFVADTAIACQRSLDPDWVPDWVQESLVPISERCRALLGDDPDEYESPWLLRKLAEALEEMAAKVEEALGHATPESIREGLLAYAKEYHTQADELEQQEGQGDE